MVLQPYQQKRNPNFGKDQLVRKIEELLNYKHPTMAKSMAMTFFSAHAWLDAG